MKYYFSCLLIFLVVTGCLNVKKQNIQETIVQQASNCENSNCVVNISKLTDFKWDKMYVFNVATSPDEISNAIGIDYPYYQEFSKSMVFLYKKKIVHYENNEEEIETATDQSVYFDYPDSLRYRVYTPKQTVFKVTKVNFGKGSYYLLY